MPFRTVFLAFAAAQLLSIFTPNFALASSASNLLAKERGVIGSAASLSIIRGADHSGYTDPAANGGYMLTVG